ncbi:MarR family winged helix-turn-helix transcriptional regulator [Agromyces kandeliae]|uniref:MarR family transcriptional regulator n=1 Tax=Agromyces kandeliae TaxID=2666141 RepID=A0A6L5R587_9MICO|nr:MarR family transcriptional regulator [Agromyces kandeliae]MRX45241.1 MarR family transcriptional regulator [Agromyces kandeliae]
MDVHRAPDETASLALGFELRIAAFRFSRRLRAERVVDTMSDAHFAILSAISSHGPHTLGELAQRERVTAPSMNYAVNALEQAGYVVRATDAGDRRRVRVALTARGAEVVTETVRRRDAWMDDALAELSDSDREVLRRATVILNEIADR